MRVDVTLPARTQIYDAKHARQSRLDMCQKETLPTETEKQATTGAMALGNSSPENPDCRQLLLRDSVHGDRKTTGHLRQHRVLIAVVNSRDKWMQHDATSARRVTTVFGLGFWTWGRANSRLGLLEGERN